MKIYPPVRPGGVLEKKIQCNQPGEPQNRNISPIWGEAPTERIEMQICTGVDLADVNVDVKFKFENFFRDFDVMGIKICPFPIDFARGPYHSAALPVNAAMPSIHSSVLSVRPVRTNRSREEQRRKFRFGRTCTLHV